MSKKAEVKHPRINPLTFTGSTPPPDLLHQGGSKSEEIFDRMLKHLKSLLLSLVGFLFAAVA